MTLDDRGGFLAVGSDCISHEVLSEELESSTKRYAWKPRPEPKAVAVVSTPRQGNTEPASAMDFTRGLLTGEGGRR